MASSGYVDTSSYEGVYVRLQWSVVGTNLVSNTSDVQFTLTFRGTYNKSMSSLRATEYTFSATTLRNKPDASYYDLNRKNKEENVSATYGNGTTIKQWTNTFKHNEQGDLSLLVTVSVRLREEGFFTNSVHDVSNDSYYTMALDHIPQKSTFTIGNNAKEFGGTYSATITRESSDFLHSLSVKLKLDSDTVTYTVINKTAEIQPTFSINMEWCSHVPNSAFVFADFILKTWSGNQVIGSTVIESTVFVPVSATPTINSFTITEATPGLANQFDGFVEGKSALNWNCEAQGSYGSTIKSYSIELPDNTYSTATGTSGILNNVRGTIIAAATIIDSRNRVDHKQVSLTVYPYGAPKVIVFNPFRSSDGVTEDKNGTILCVDLDLSVFGVNNRNPVSFGFGYRIAGSNGSFTALQHTIPSNTYAYDNVQIFNKTGDPTFSVDYAYEIRMAITDYFGTTYKYGTIASGVTVFDVTQDGTGICFGGVAQNNNEFRIVGKKSVFEGGLCYAANAIASGDDLNDIKTAGFYFGDPGTSASHSIGNSPAYNAPIVLEVFDTGTAAKMQRVTVCNGTAPVVFVRFYASSAWSSWVSV